MMKIFKTNCDYESPKTFPVEVFLEGVLCVSGVEEYVDSGSHEGFGTKDSFSW